MDEYKQELLPIAFKQAKGIKEKIAELGLSITTTEEQQDALVISLSKDKAVISGKPFKSHLSGMEWYVTSLIEKSQLGDKELLQATYKELLPANSTFDELVGMM